MSFAEIGRYEVSAVDIDDLIQNLSDTDDGQRNSPTKERVRLERGTNLTMGVRPTLGPSWPDASANVFLINCEKISKQNYS